LMAWTDERVALLTRLWNEGHTASQIAERFGDITRNAVIGKVHRLGLSGRAAASRFRAARIRVRSRAVPQMRSGGMGGYATHGNTALKADTETSPAEWNAPARRAFLRPVEQPAAEMETGPVIGLLELKESSCRWPVGHPDQPGFGFCGCQKADHGPYCEKHAAIAYQPVQRRQAKKEAA